MILTRYGLAACLAAALAGCATRRPPQAPPVEPSRPQVVRPPVAEPPPPVVAWTDAPLSPGTWIRSAAAVSGASYGPPGQPALTVRCEADRRVTVALSGTAARALTIRTSSAARTLPARAVDGAAVASLAASDPLLDAMAFSRGRFAVEAAGAPPLIVPAWPELARVVEDCRG